MATDTVTIHLPDDLHRRLERLAALTHQPLEGLIVRTLSSNLPPLPDDLPPASRDALQALEALSDEELRQRASAMLSQGLLDRLEELRGRRGDGTLTADEQGELDVLLAAADLVTLEKAYAAVLLKWRGQPLLPLDTRTSAEA